MLEATGVDLAALAAWMDSQGLGAGPICDVTHLVGGTQNVMLRFTRSGRTFVLRRGPVHLRPRSNETMAREVRFLAALTGTGVAHPRLIRACLDTTLLGSVFYLMEPIHGFNAAVELPALHASDARVRQQMSFALVESLAALAEIDYAAAGLSDFGRPKGFLERQVPRWLAELESYKRLADYRASGVPKLEPVAAWLQSHLPQDWKPGIMHGDYHLANVMFSYTGPEVAAIVDWEMVTIGDPLLDLGWLLATWPREDGGTDFHGSPLAAAGGLPRGEELVEHYADRSGRDMTSIAWYAVMACFKLGILLEGTYARSLEGKASRATGDYLWTRARALFERASTLIAEA